jgi:hypothetical protein
MLNPVSLLPFPDLGSTDPRFHDQLNSSVESFILQFRQTGYCTIVLPSGTYQPGIRKHQPANWTGIYEGELDPFHQSFVRGKALYHGTGMVPLSDYALSDSESDLFYIIHSYYTVIA